ncbi:phosphoribosylglycinamide formyltransferase [bacterium]|nr:MAG: phosphoribosylglycinamide formyltransferase [bacterium]
MLNIGVLVSGSGTNLQAIIDAIEAKRLDAKIAVVISNKPDAFALTRAEKHGIDTRVIVKDAFPDRETFDAELVRVLNEHKVELVALAGFLRILTPVFTRAFPMRIMNIHPSLLPSFTGLDVQRKAIEYGVKFSGCTVHFVDEGLDTGPIIMQAVVPVTANDTTETLAKRILEEEHKIYPEAIRLYAEGKFKILGRRVLSAESGTVEASLENPPIKK